MASKSFPVDLLAVELDESPVLDETRGAGTDKDGRRVGDVAYDALVLCAPELPDVGLELG